MQILNFDCLDKHKDTLVFSYSPQIAVGIRS